MIPAYWSPTKKLMVLGAMAGGKLVEDTATGNPLAFITDKAKPLKSLLIPFTPQQEGTGDPSPQNIRSILPWNGLTVFGGGKNLLNPDGIVHNSYNIGGFVNTLKPNTKYTISINGTTDKAYRLYMTTESAPLSGTTPVSKGYIFAGQKETFTTPSEMTGILVLAGNNAGAGNVPIDSILPMIEAGETATAYEPYKPITDTDIVFPSPVYGGTLDVVSGVLTVEWAALSIATLPREHWVKSSSYPGGFYINVSAVNPAFKRHTPFMCSHGKTVSNISEYVNGTVFCDSSLNFRFMDESATLPDWYSYMDEQVQAGTPIIACYQLATPQEIQLTPAQLTALIGDNTIWSDADGSMTAVYLKKG